MRIAASLVAGTLLRRYKRFLADVRLDGGETVTAHCPNPGSLLGCLEGEARVLLRCCDKPSRKLPYTWVLVFVGGSVVNIDTQLPNAVVHEAVVASAIPELSGYAQVRREVRFRDSRFDLGLTQSDAAADRPDCLVEVKSTTLVERGEAMFPDCPTARGRKHLETLAEAARQGVRAVQFYLVSRSDARAFRPADHIDPAYGEALRAAARSGVEVMAWDVEIVADLDKPSMTVRRPVPVRLDGI